MEFERPGGTRTLRVHVRLVAATNRDLVQMIADHESGRKNCLMHYVAATVPDVLKGLPILLSESAGDYRSSVLVNRDVEQ